MRAAVFFICLWTVSACGVKGPPRPPKASAELSRGQPTYKRAMRGIVMPSGAEEESEKDEENER